MAAAELARGPRAPGRVAGAEQHDVAALRELAAHLQADAAVGARDEGDASTVSRRGGRPCRRCGGRGGRGSPRPGSRQLVSRSICGSRRPAATRASRRASIPRRPAALGQLGEDEQAVERAPGARPNSARVGNSTGALGSLLAKETTVPSARDALDRGAERRAADALDDHVELRPLGRELVEDLVGAELGEAAGALGAGRDGGDVGAAEVGELDGEAADAAAGAGDQHAPADRVAADVEREQRGDAGDGERRGLGEADRVGQRPARACGRDGGELGPRPVVAGRRRGCPRAARCRRRRRARPPGEVPAGELPGRLAGQRLDLAAVERDAWTATSASLGSGSGSGASVSSTPGSAAEVSRASMGRTLPIGGSPAGDARIDVMDPHAHPAPSPTAYAARRRAFEDAWLSPLAARSYPARRARPEDDCGLRTPLQRDRDRIVHSKAFRRLKHKTQVFVAPEGDHYRTRLTHTLEVTQISRTVARALRLNEDLDRGDRPGPRPRPPAVRPHRRGRARRLPARALRPRLPPLRALAARRRRARARRPG